MRETESGDSVSRRCRSWLEPAQVPFEPAANCRDHSRAASSESGNEGATFRRRGCRWWDMMGSVSSSEPMLSQVLYPFRARIDGLLHPIV
jgi:hypothetical protein